MILQEVWTMVYYWESKIKFSTVLEHDRVIGEIWNLHAFITLLTLKRSEKLVLKWLPIKKPSAVTLGGFLAVAIKKSLSSLVIPISWYVLQHTGRLSPLPRKSRQYLQLWTTLEECNWWIFQYMVTQKSAFKNHWQNPEFSSYNAFT